MRDEKKFHTVEGKRLPLRRVNSARLVSPTKDSHLCHVSARLARSTRLGIDTKVPTDFLVVRGDTDKLEEIRDYPDVKCTRSVFTDENGLELALTDDVLVKFTDKIGYEERQELCKKLNCSIIEDTGDLWRIRVLDLDDDAPLDVANNLSEEAEVVFAEPDALQKAEYTAVTPPTDTLFANQWHLHNTGQGGGTAGADVDALGAWGITYGSPKIRVVVHDTGVDITHPDLKANIVSGWDFDNNDADASNNNGPHGTACAGVIAASRNGKGVVGIAPSCKISPLRAAGAHTWSTWAKTFEWAAKHGEIISCSWTISENNILSDAIRKAIREGRKGRGIPVFFATANGSSSTIGYPAKLAETIAVGASTNKDVRPGYSNYGSGIDFVAPSNGGTRAIETTDVQGKYGYNKKSGAAGNYCKANDGSGFGGTSSATPLAAGVAALMLSVNPLLTVKQVRKILQETAVKIDSNNAKYDANGWSKYYGYGRIDAAKAVKAAKAFRPVALRAHNGQYVCAEGGGGQEVVANRDQLATWETLQLIDLGNDNVALRVHNGQYVCAEGGGGQKVVANRDLRKSWETFKLIKLGKNKVALQAKNGQYVCAEGGGGGKVVADRNKIANWEAFELVELGPDNKVAFKAHNGQYVCAEGGGGQKVVANRDLRKSWETFEVIDLGNGNVALRVHNGQYVCAEGGGGQEVVANRDRIGSWETFQLIDLGNSKVALQAKNGQYVCAEGGGGGKVVADRNKIANWETFKLEKL